MTGFWVLDLACLAVVLSGAVLVLTVRNTTAAVVALSAVGTVLGLLFLVLGAPDVAHAQIVVGAVALPVLFLLAIGKTRTDVVDRGGLGGEEPDQHGDAGDG